MAKSTCEQTLSAAPTTRPLQHYNSPSSSKYAALVVLRQFRGIKAGRPIFFCFSFLTSHPGNTSAKHIMCMRTCSSLVSIYGKLGGDGDAAMSDICPHYHKRFPLQHNIFISLPGVVPYYLPGATAPGTSIGRYHKRFCQ